MEETIKMLDEVIGKFIEPAEVIVPVGVKATISNQEMEGLLRFNKAWEDCRNHGSLDDIIWTHQGGYVWSPKTLLWHWKLAGTNPQPWSEQS